MASPQKSESGPTKGSKLPAPLPQLIRWGRESIALALWSLISTHLLVIDLGPILTSAIPSAEPLLRFRLPVLLGAVAFFWLLLGNQKFLRFFGYILAYPFVVVLWKLPKFAFRNWAVVIAFSPAIHAVAASLRLTFTLFTVALISALVVYLADSQALIASGMSLLGLHLLFHYLRRFRVAFSPSTAFADLGGLVSKSWNFFKDGASKGQPKGDPYSDLYQQQTAQLALTVYMASAGLHFLAARLKEVVDSKKMDLYFIGSLVYTFLLTVLIFAIQYLGLERLHPASFHGVPDPGFIDFLALSFSMMMTASSISPLQPETGEARLISYIQLSTVGLIGILMVFVVLTSIRERYRQDLDAAIVETRRAADQAGAWIEQNLELTIEAAEALLLEQNGDLARWMLRVRYGEDQAKQIPGYVVEPDYKKVEFDNKNVEADDKSVEQGSEPPNSE